MTVWILNPLILYKRLTWRRDYNRVAVFALVICSDVQKPMCWEMVIKNCTPLTNIMSAHRVIMIYFDLMKVGKEEKFGGLTADGAFLGVLPCSDWMLGPRICSATCIVDGLLKIAVLSAAPLPRMRKNNPRKM